MLMIHETEELNQQSLKANDTLDKKGKKSKQMSFRSKRSHATKRRLSKMPEVIVKNTSETKIEKHSSLK